MNVKCRKCRYELAANLKNSLLNAHGDKISVLEDCSSKEQDSLLFIEETSLSWIETAINEANYTKGRINCPKCEARIGSFDFICNIKCACGSQVTPSVHLVKSKLDIAQST